jgi:NitT/TauT family transport system permease protein
MDVEATDVQLTRNDLPEDVERRSIWERVPRALSIGAFVALLFAVWQLVFWSQWTSEFILPAPLDVAREVGEMLKDMATGGFILDNFWITLKEIVLGLLLAAVAGIGLGAIVGETHFGRIVLMPFLVAVNAAPKVAFAPIFVAWFGFGISAKVAMGAFIAFFPLLIDTAAGLAAVGVEQVRLFRALRASRWQTFYKLKLPAALPFVFAGLKTAAVLAVVGAVVGEFLGGGDGLGGQIRVAASNLATDRVFAYVVILSAIGYAAYALVALVERKVVFWHSGAILPGSGM